jgi:hypothetical protein
VGKKTISDLKPVIRAVKQDAKRIGLAFDGLKAFAALAIDSTEAEGLAAAQRELSIAIASMRANLDAIANRIAESTELSD